MFEIGDVVELDYEALDRAHCRQTYVDWANGRTAWIVNHLDKNGRGEQLIGLLEAESRYACFHGPYFKLAGPPRTVRAMSMKIVRELTQ